MPRTVKGPDTGSRHGLIAGMAERVVLLVEMELAVRKSLERVGLLGERLVAGLAVVAARVPALSECFQVLTLNQLSTPTTRGRELLCEIGLAIRLSITLYKPGSQNIVANVTSQMLGVPGSSKGKDDPAGDQLSTGVVEFSKKRKRKRVVNILS